MLLLVLEESRLYMEQIVQTATASYTLHCIRYSIPHDDLFAIKKNGTIGVVLESKKIPIQRIIIQLSGVKNNAYVQQTSRTLGNQGRQR